MTVVMITVVVAAFLGMAGMMPRSFCMPGSFLRTTCISDGVGIVTSRLAIVTMLGGVVCAVVGGIRMTGTGVGIRLIVIGMMAVAGSVFITGVGRQHKDKGSKCNNGFHKWIGFSLPDVKDLDFIRWLCVRPCIHYS